MKRAMAWVMVLACALVLVAPKAQAQRPPETHPSSEHRDIVMSWDRSALPGDVVLWAPKTVLGYEQTGRSGYGRLYLTCVSAVDSGSGRCPIADTLQNDSEATSEIALRFSEARSGASTDLTVRARLKRIDSTAACSLDYWSRSNRYIWSSVTDICHEESVGTGISMTIDSIELGRLVAGKWSGTLILRLNRPPGTQEANFEFKFDFDVSDKNAVAIYLPEFDHATPSVDLNLRYNPFAHSIEGRKLLDMCLYDGLGSNSNYLGVTVRDTGGRTPGPTGFSVWHDSGGSDERRRLDYTLALDHNGTSIPLANGVEQQLTGIDSARLRLVMLPGMTLPVFCVPTPLTLTTPRFPSTSKEAGHYTGDLQVELRVPTAMP